MEVRYDPGSAAVLRQMAEGEFDAKEWFDLKTEAERLSLTDGFDRLLSLEAPKLHLYEHQRRAVLQVLGVLRGRAILADEVGLGKTIEAGVILKEYMLRGLVRRALILVPASLVHQWRAELREKLGLSFRIGRTGKDFVQGERLLASLDTAKGPRCAEAVLARPWDMVIVDEAHRLKNQQTRNWQFVNSIQKKFLLLLTATPVQNDLRELYNLVTLLKPGQLKTYTHFKRSFVADKHSPKNTAQLKAALAEVMVRSGRRESLLPFPRREVRTLLLPLAGPERAYYNAVVGALREAYAQSDRKERSLLPLILILREACSHPLAAQRTLAAMCGRGTLPTLSAAQVREFGEQLRGILPAKVRALGELVAELDDAAAVIFTEFRTTQRELARALEAMGHPCHLFHGGMSAQEKEEAVQRFREAGGFLISTESGGEGRNLQFCRTVINFDLPWNPMRVEQRIGRVHRLGQRHTVRVVNMVTDGTIDRHVLYLLDKKIGMFQRVIGEIDEILASLPQSFESAVAKAVLSSGDEEELVRRIEAFGAELEEAYRRYDRVRRLNRLLFEPLEEVQ